jgi:hypothetical protein
LRLTSIFTLSIFSASRFEAGRTHHKPIGADIRHVLSAARRNLRNSWFNDQAIEPVLELFVAPKN